jgi:NAD(P)-dependent dehydrogenase (short-subunit alcohol dehydrogenase family)
MAHHTWLITGTSTGFGNALTRTLLERGDRVIATIRKEGALADLEARHGARLRVRLLDVTDTAAIRRVVAAAVAWAGRLDVVVSNAGYALFGAGEELGDEQIRHQIETNLVGSIQLIRAALPHLRAQGGGRILQISSEGGQTVYPSFSLYHATKWAVEGFVESVALEVAPFGIELTLVEPGPTLTSFGASVVHSAPMAAYEATPAGEVRRALAGGTFPITGDVNKMADAIIASVDVSPAPRRLTLGRTAYASIEKALRARLAALEAQRDIALGCDVG